MKEFRIQGIEPKVVLPGGLVRIAVSRFDAAGDVRIFFNSEPAQFVGASSDFILARVPEVQGRCTVTIGESGYAGSAAFAFAPVAIAGELNPVGNPAVDRQGNIFVAFSGPRGEAVPFSVYRIAAGSFAKEPYLADIVNATGIAVGTDGTLYISSRHTGAIYRCDNRKNLDKFAENLGIATGLALDSAGNLYVGDRGGVVYRLDRAGKAESVCEIEPSVSAFHLTMRQDDVLFVSGPTLATQDNIYEVGADRKPKVFFRGIGRPQGMAFDSAGRLLVAGSYRGRRGVFAIGPGSRLQQLVSSPMLVGVLVTAQKDLVLADSDTLYHVPAGQW